MLDLKDWNSIYYTVLVIYFVYSLVIDIFVNILWLETNFNIVVFPDSIAALVSGDPPVL